MEQKFRVGKSTMDRYDIRLEGGDHWRCAWAVISISSDGLFNAQTDCGNFSYKCHLSGSASNRL